MDEVRKIHNLREAIIRLLLSADEGGDGFGFTADQFVRFIAPARLDRSAAAAEIRQQLKELWEANLIRARYDEGLSDSLYTIQARGRAFARAGYPWGKVDEF
jgi:hypothetical protein